MCSSSLFIYWPRPPLASSLRTLFTRRRLEDLSPHAVGRHCHENRCHPIRMRRARHRRAGFRTFVTLQLCPAELTCSGRCVDGDATLLHLSGCSFGGCCKRGGLATTLRDLSVVPATGPVPVCRPGPSSRTLSRVSLVAHMYTSDYAHRGVAIRTAYRSRFVCSSCEELPRSSGKRENVSSSTCCIKSSTGQNSASWKVHSTEF